jgi:hypothetical protein
MSTPMMGTRLRRGSWFAVVAISRRLVWVLYPYTVRQYHLFIQLSPLVALSLSAGITQRIVGGTKEGRDDGAHDGEG